MSTPVVWAGLFGACLLTVLGVELLDGHARSARRATREMAVLGLSRGVVEYVDSHAGAVAMTAERISAWQALPPEALERALAEVGAVYPALRRVFVARADGGIVAAFEPGGDTKAPPVGTGAPGAGGAFDGSEERRRAMGEVLAPAEGAAVKDARVWFGASTADSGTLEMAAPVFGSGGASRLYVGADLSLHDIRELLAGAEARANVALGLEGGGGHVLYPTDRPLPVDAWRSELGQGLILHVAFPPRRPALRYLVAALVAALTGLTLMLVSRKA